MNCEGIFRSVVRASACVALSAMLLGQQQESLPVTLPDGPAKSGFDIKRFSNLGNGWFQTFYPKKYDSLKKALGQGKVAASTRVLVLETAGGRLALINDQMVFHHIAQGRAGGKDWMATF